MSQTEAARQPEVEFLEDLNALVSETIEQNSDPWQALKQLATEIRNRIAQLEP